MERAQERLRHGIWVKRERPVSIKADAGSNCCTFQMSRRGGGGGRGRKEKKKDVWDVEGGYMGMKKQKLEEQFREQVCFLFKR